MSATSTSVTTTVMLPTAATTRTATCSTIPITMTSLSTGLAYRSGGGARQLSAALDKEVEAQIIMTGDLDSDQLSYKHRNDNDDDDDDVDIEPLVATNTTTTTSRFFPDVSGWEKVEPQLYRRKPKSIRRFYEEQNLLIENLLAFYTNSSGNSDDGDNDNHDMSLPPDPYPVSLAIHSSFALNVLLLVLKIIAAVLSGSMAVIASAADSLLDLLSGSVLVITHRVMKKSDTFHYPQGKSRMEPIGVFSFAIIMMLSSMQIIIEALRRLVSRPEIDLGIFTMVILAFTIFSKAFLGWYCRQVARRFKSSAAAAYAEDHRNDVLTNLFGVVAAVLAVYALEGQLWFLDSTGAIGIALYIIFGWMQTGREQFRFLTGRGASPMLLQQLTYIAANHDPRIKYVDTVRAYHFGVSYLVEVDIVLPEDMTLRESHDIGESLQHRIEQLEDVERAFVHNDFEWDHSPVVYRGTQIIRK